jgi:hypothetical protein
VIFCASKTLNSRNKAIKSRNMKKKINKAILRLINPVSGFMCAFEQTSAKDFQNSSNFSVQSLLAENDF